MVWSFFISLSASLHFSSWWFGHANRGLSICKLNGMVAQNSNAPFREKHFHMKNAGKSGEDQLIFLLFTLFLIRLLKCIFLFYGLCHTTWFMRYLYRHLSCWKWDGCHGTTDGRVFDWVESTPDTSVSSCFQGYLHSPAANYVSLPTNAMANDGLQRTRVRFYSFEGHSGGFRPLYVGLLAPIGDLFRICAATTGPSEPLRMENRTGAELRCNITPLFLTRETKGSIDRSRGVTMWMVSRSFVERWTRSASLHVWEMDEKLQACE